MKIKQPKYFIIFKTFFLTYWKAIIKLLEEKPCFTDHQYFAILWILEIVKDPMKFANFFANVGCAKPVFIRTRKLIIIGRSHYFKVSFMVLLLPRQR